MNVDITTPLNDTQRDTLIDSIAQKVVAKRLETPVIMFLEMHKPLSFLASQSLLVAMPFIGPLLGMEKTVEMSKLLQDRENVERLVSRIEQISIGRGTADQPAIDK